MRLGIGSSLQPDRGAVRLGFDTVAADRALSYSAYCENLRKYQSKKVAVFRHIHVSGRSQQTDYAGYQPVGIDEAGNNKKFNLFLCVLPYSHYIFANVTPSQSTIDYIRSHIAALEYFGAPPRLPRTPCGVYRIAELATAI